jgi:Protein of unknown function (DUF1308)/Family of unknown function (DUF5614)
LKTETLTGCDDVVDVSRKLQCTNLNFFSHLVYSLYKYEEITSISTVRKFDDLSVKIDFIANDNQTWVKIIARNSESIKDEVLGRCEYGAKDIFSVADEFAEVAASQLNFFRAPNVVFDFLNPIDEYLEEALESKGIILGRKFKYSPSLIECSTLNVDVTTMLAFVSELSNGGTSCTFKEKLLEEQARLERKDPIKPFLDKVFAGKKLICCKTAVNSFNEIVELLAGPKEKLRAEAFKKEMTVLPDIEKPEQIINLELSAQIKERSRKIFAFGIFHQAVAISSNAGFKRSAKMKNLDIPMITHSARALTEKKQLL